MTSEKGKLHERIPLLAFCFLVLLGLTVFSSAGGRIKDSSDDEVWVSFEGDKIACSKNGAFLLSTDYRNSGTLRKLRWHTALLPGKGLVGKAMVVELSFHKGISWTKGSTHSVHEIDSFLSGYTGFFGVVGVDDFSEQPFFATRGSLTVLETDASGVRCAIDMYCEDAEGASLRIKGRVRLQLGP